jgi:predicted dehydrogenase
MSELTQVGVGIIGMGFMGATHFRAYQAAHAAGFQCRVIAVSDRSPERLMGHGDVVGNISTGHGERLFDPTQLRTCKDPRDLLSDPRVHLVSICTHTETHVDLALAAIRAGKHVLVEKPVAVRSEDARKLAAAVRESGKLCMPAMCMRFWPGWTWLRDRVRDGRFGKVHSAVFQRLGTVPTWSPEFYGDPARSGGSHFDLHIHDTDFIQWCFGPPRRVVSTGSIMHVTTLYQYDADRGPRHVVAEGGQDCSPGFGFRMRFTVAFEKATADFELSRTPTVLLHRDGKSEPVELPHGTAYDGQIRHLLDAILGARGDADLMATMDEAVAVTELLEAERKSFETGEPVAVG